MSEVDRINLFCHRENAAWAQQKKRLPVTLVTGFLGSGKTTLLRYILSNKENLRIAAAVNDFAAVNIDAGLVSRNAEDNKQEVVALTNGCMCCSISQDLRQAVWKLLQECDSGHIDYLVIETSGISDPLSSIRTLEEDYGKMYRVRLDSVVTVVDSDFFSGKLEEVESSGQELPVAAASQLK